MCADLFLHALQARLPRRWHAVRVKDDRLRVERPYRIGDGAGASLTGADADELVRLAWKLEGSVTHDAQPKESH